MPLIATRGAASAQGFGEFAQAAAPVYIEDVFSTYLYTGTGSSNTITNNIDISGKGGLVWAKGRTNAEVHGLFDTARGANLWLSSNTTDAQTTYGGSFGVTAFNNNGFTLGTGTAVNAGTVNYVSWTFREQPKFFDVVTYTGNGSNRTISHNLGSVPGCIIVKRTDTTSDWSVYHVGLNEVATANQVRLLLNSTAANSSASSTYWNNTTPTSTEFSLGTSTSVNANSGTYVAYLFASDAGGFGDAGSDSIIKCDFYNGNGSATGPSVTLNWEPQFLMIKRASGVGDWNIIDNMRGFVVGGTDAVLNPNSSAAESTGTFVTPTATGFQINTTDTVYNDSGSTYIYIAIRRGPMKTPTTGTSVFLPIKNGSPTQGPLTDMSFGRNALNTTEDWWMVPRLTNARLKPNTTGTEFDTSSYINWASMVGFINNGWVDQTNSVVYNVRRAPGFFDVVCYTGTGTTPQNITHNLGVAPELMIVKVRNEVRDWTVYSGNAGQYLLLNTTDAVTSNTNVWDNTAPSSTVFRVGNFGTTNSSGKNIVAYLFASVSGVSKVGTYTGTGTTLQVNCGFTNGSRFVLIKRTDSTGDWYVWDSARGIVAGNDPYLLLNSTAAEVTNTDYVDTYSAGFEISSTAPAAINANGGTFIFLAIA